MHVAGTRKRSLHCEACEDKRIQGNVNRNTKAAQHHGLVVILALGGVNRPEFMTKRDASDTHKNGYGQSPSSPTVDDEDATKLEAKGDKRDHNLLDDSAIPHIDEVTLPTRPFAYFPPHDQMKLYPEMVLTPQSHAPSAENLDFLTSEIENATKIRKEKKAVNTRRQTEKEDFISTHVPHDLEDVTALCTQDEIPLDRSVEIQLLIHHFKGMYQASSAPLLLRVRAVQLEAMIAEMC